MANKRVDAIICCILLIFAFWCSTPRRRGGHKGRPISSWVGDQQRIPAVVCFPFYSSLGGTSSQTVLLGTHATRDSQAPKTCERLPFFIASTDPVVWCELIDNLYSTYHLAACQEPRTHCARQYIFTVSYPPRF